LNNEGKRGERERREGLRGDGSEEEESKNLFY